MVGGSLTLSNHSFIIRLLYEHSLRAALCTKASWKRHEFAVTEEPWEYSWSGRGCNNVLNGVEVMNEMTKRILVNWLSLNGSLEQSCSVWKPTVSFIFRDILSYRLFQTEVSLLFRRWKFITQSLYIKMLSSMFVWVRCADFFGGRGKIVIPVK